MTPQLLIFLGAIFYLTWALIRYFKPRSKSEDRSFIEVLDEEIEQLPPPKVQQEDTDDEKEWRRRVRAEIEDMTK